MPLHVDLDVRFIHAGRIVGRTQRRPTPLVQLWRIALDPAKHGGVVDPHAAFAQEFFQVALAQQDRIRPVAPDQRNVIEIG